MGQNQQFSSLKKRRLYLHVIPFAGPKLSGIQKRQDTKSLDLNKL